MSHTLDRLLPLVSPGDSVVLIHIVDESVEDMIAGETVDGDQVFLKAVAGEIFRITTIRGRAVLHVAIGFLDRERNACTKLLGTILCKQKRRLKSPFSLVERPCLD